MAEKLSIIEAVAENSAPSQQIPYLGLRQKIHEWETLGADQVLIHGIKHGVAASMHQIPRKMPPRHGKAPPEIEQVIFEYLHRRCARAVCSPPYGCSS